MPWPRSFQGLAVEFVFGVQVRAFRFDAKHLKHTKCINHTGVLSSLLSVHFPSLRTQSPHVHCHSLGPFHPSLCARVHLPMGTQEMQKLTFPASFAARAWALLLGGFVLPAELGSSDRAGALRSSLKPGDSLPRARSLGQRQCGWWPLPRAWPSPPFRSLSAGKWPYTWPLPDPAQAWTPGPRDICYMSQSLPQTQSIFKTKNIPVHKQEGLKLTLTWKGGVSQHWQF